MLEWLLKALWILTCLGLSLALGLGFFGASPSLHMTVGIMASLLYFFAALFWVFYFVGTAVWIRDQSRQSYLRDKSKGQQMWDLYGQANKLKGKSMPLLSFGLVIGMFTFILGAGFQVGALPAWVHPTLGTLWWLMTIAGTPLLFKTMTQNLGFLDQTSAVLDSISN